MRSQQQRSAESARRLIDAAIELGSERGFDRTSLADICRRAGYSRAMVNERYGSKAGLLQAVMSTRFEPWMVPSRSPGHTGLQLGLAHVDRFRSAAEDGPKTLRAFLALCYETTGPMPELAEWMTASLRRYRASVATALAQGQQDGSVRLDLDCNAAARHFTAYVLGCGLQWTLNPQLLDLSAELLGLRERLDSEWRAEPRH